MPDIQQPVNTAATGLNQPPAAATADQTPRVFKLNKGSSILWAGMSLESIRAKYLDLFGVEPDLRDPRELTKTEMLASRVTYHDKDDLHHERPKERNFLEHLDAMIANGHAFPWFFFADGTHLEEWPSTAAPQDAPVFVWKLNDYEWWAGASLDDIRVDYERETGVDPDGPEGFESPRQLSDAEMLRVQYHYDDYDNSKTRTFREQLDLLIASGRTFPCFFAGTES